MSKPNFNLDLIKTLSPIEAKKYIDSYFIPLTDSTHAVYINGKYEIYDTRVINGTWFNRMSNELKTYYFKDKTDLKTITYDINKPQFYDYYLNMCPPIMHKYKPFKEFSLVVVEKVNMMLKHILEVLCSNKEDAYEFLLKWLSNMVRGNRNDSAIYLKGPQGAGKSTPIEFLRDHVIGRPLCHQGGSGPLKNKFNSELSGTLMVMFEELENMTVAEWTSVSSVLKRQITSKTINIERKQKEVIEEINLNNYILLSNNDAIKDDDGRRYFILDINTKYIGDTLYFDKIYSQCFNDTVGHAFYCYLMEIDLTDYNAQKYPLTSSKLDSYANRLDNVYKFIKDKYILKNLSINKILVAELHAEYELYCIDRHIKAKNKIEFNKCLESVNIKRKHSNDKNYYSVSIVILKEIANKFHWIHELDEYEGDDDYYEKKEATVLKSEYDELVKKYEELKQQKSKGLKNKSKKKNKSKPEEPKEPTESELEEEFNNLI